MQIDSLDYNDQTLRVACSGVHGIGSHGHPSAKLLNETIMGWMRAHPMEPVDQLIIDYSKVQYEWGDGPVSSVIGFIKQGVKEIRLIGAHNNIQSLRSLVKACNIPWIIVDDA